MSIPAKYTCLTGGMWSCSDDDDETESVVITQTSTDETSEVYATSATFKLATRGVESFAYQVVEGADATAPAGEVIYAEAQENNIVFLRKMVIMRLRYMAWRGIKLILYFLP